MKLIGLVWVSRRVHVVMKAHVALYTLNVYCMDDHFNLREDITRQMGDKLALCLGSPWLTSIFLVKCVLLIVLVRECGYKSTAPNSICLKLTFEMGFTWAQVSAFFWYPCSGGLLLNYILAVSKEALSKLSNMLSGIHALHEFYTSPSLGLYKSAIKVCDGVEHSDVHNLSLEKWFI